MMSEYFYMITYYISRAQSVLFSAAFTSKFSFFCCYLLDFISKNRLGKTVVKAVNLIFFPVELRVGGV